MVAVVVLLVVQSGCGNGDSGTEGPPVSLAGRVNNHGTATATDDLELEADDVYFAPTFIKPKPGQRFTVEVHNEGSARHTFTSSELGADLELPPGARRTVPVTAPATGLADFHCRFHEGQGMKGAVYIG